MGKESDHHFLRSGRVPLYEYGYRSVDSPPLTSRHVLPDLVAIPNHQLDPDPDLFAMGTQGDASWKGLVHASGTLALDADPGHLKADGREGRENNNRRLAGRLDLPSVQ